MKKDSQRGMKKWAPFSALEGQNDEIQRIIKQKNKPQKPILSDDQIDDINYHLSSSLHHIIKVLYFDEEILEIKGEFKKINTYDGYILVENNKINISSIIKITRIDTF